jgi:hypothetical protein
MCQWLNDIGNALRQVYPGTYTNTHRDVVTLLKRVWSSAYSSIYLKQDADVNHVPHHKPDVILMDEDSDGEITWAQVHALTEVTRTPLTKN